MNTLPSENNRQLIHPRIANYQPKLIPWNLEKRPGSIPKKSAHAATRDKKPKQKTSNRNKIKPHPLLLLPLRINWRSTFNPLPSDNLAVSPPDSATRVDEARRQGEREKEREGRATPHRGRKSKNRPHKSPRTMAPIVCTTLTPPSPLLTL